MSIKQAIEALETCLAMADYGDFSTGCCCCGSSVEGHTMGDGHSPVDEGDYHAINAFDKARAALAALRSMPAEPVAYLDVGMGGYLDLGTDLRDEQLSALPPGRHMLAIIGTFGIDGYVPATNVPETLS